MFPNELDDGWRAVLLVTGDVGAVLEAYRRQAAAAGLPFRAAPTCEDTGDTLTCGARGVSDDGRRALEVAVWRGRVGHDSTPVSHAHLELSEPKAPSPPRERPFDGPILAASPPLPTGWDLPDVGERFLDELTVEPDSELVAPVAPVPGGVRAVFRIHAHPVEVMRAYDSQWRNDPAAPPPQPWSDPDGAYVLVDSGVEHRIEIVSRPGHTTWAWVTANRAW